MKNLFFISMLITLFFSCQKNEEQVKEQKRTEFEFRKMNKKDNIKYPLIDYGCDFSEGLESFDLEFQILGDKFQLVKLDKYGNVEQIIFESISFETEIEIYEALFYFTDNYNNFDNYFVVGDRFIFVDEDGNTIATSSSSLRICELILMSLTADAETHIFESQELKGGESEFKFQILKNQNDFFWELTEINESGFLLKSEMYKTKKEVLLSILFFRNNCKNLSLYVDVKSLFTFVDLDGNVIATSEIFSKEKKKKKKKEKCPTVEALVIIEDLTFVEKMQIIDFDPFVLIEDII